MNVWIYTNPEPRDPNLHIVELVRATYANNKHLCHKLAVEIGIGYADPDTDTWRPCEFHVERVP